MSEPNTQPVPLCQDCKHADKKGDNPRFWTCLRTVNAEYEELKRVVASVPGDVRRGDWCVLQRKYAMAETCGPLGKWFEPKEAA